jgi:phosphodiesterase/alkaline phosphatase D-like protein
VLRILALQLLTDQSLDIAMQTQPQQYKVGLNLFTLSSLVLLLTHTTASVAEFDGNIVLGSPTETTITANVLTATSQDIYIAYGIKAGEYSEQTPSANFTANQPGEIRLAGLQANTRYYYQLNYNEGNDSFVPGPEDSFHTPRESGSSFVFGVQGDSHPERAPRDFIPELYNQTIGLAKKDGVDFYLTTGDDFSIDSRYPDGITEDDVILNAIESNVPTLA